MNENTNNDEQDNQKGNAASPTAVTIDLDALDSTKALGEGELIFYDECRHMVDNIRKKADRNVEKLKSKDSSVRNNVVEDTQGTPNCFFINGSRGSGKSTLLRAIRHRLVNGERTSDKETPIKLYPLADVDPTELGRGENFFIYLLGKIYALLDSEFKKNNNDDITIHLIRDALQVLQNMSSGLQILMDSEGNLRKYETPEFFLENCLEKCADSSVMRMKFSLLIDTLAKIVKEEVFLITIDDADLNFSKCEDILEYVRKYMHSPRLIFLFAGDMQLYSQIVRGMQLKNFHEKQLAYDTAQKKNRKNLMKSMEEQYLMKLFPVDGREYILSLNKIVDIKHRIFLKFINKKREKEVIGIKPALRRYSMIKSDNSFIDTILRLPLRSILFLLRYLVNYPYPNNTDEANLHAWKGLHTVFQQSLIDYDLDYMEIIRTGNIGMLQKKLLEYKSKAGQWYADLSMQPLEDENDEKQVAMYLGGAVSLATMPLSAKIKYWCACFPLWQRMQEEYLHTTHEREANILLQSCLYQTNERNSNSYADLACAAMAPNLDETFLFSRGTICLLNEDCVQDNEKGQDARIGFKTLAESFLKGKHIKNLKAKKALSALGTSLCRVDDSTSSYYYLSIYHLLMEISEWLDLGNDALMELEATSQANSEILQAKVIKEKIRQKLSNRIIASSTQRIRSLQPRSIARFTRNASNLNNTGTSKASGIERMPYIHPGQSDASTVDEIYKWLTKYVSTLYISTQEDYCQAWESFKAECSEMSYKYSTEYQNVHECPKCAEILRGYVGAIEDSMAFLPNASGKTLQECIQEFPLWKALKDSLKDKSMFATELDKTRIGYYINARNRQKSHELRSAYEYYSSNIKVFEQALATAVSKNNTAQQQLVEALKLKKEREIRYKRIQKYIIDISEQQTKVSSECKSLFSLEQQLEQKIEMLRRREKEIVDSSSRVEQLLVQIEKTLKGDCDNFPEYNFLIDDLQRHTRLKNQAKTDKTEREHQKAINTIRREIKQRQMEEKNKLSAKDQKVALIDKKRLEDELSNIRTFIWDETSKMKLTAKERQIKESDLAELKKKLDDSMTREILAYVDQENARTNCSNAQKIADETQMVEDKAKNDLNNEKKLCKQAEEIYNKFKTSNPDE